jgi:integrase
VLPTPLFYYYHILGAKLLGTLCTSFILPKTIMPQHNKIFRDMPTKVLEILINLAFINARDIVFALCLQIFAGLRPGEVCNVRQDNSPLGCGIIQTINDNKVLRIEIDLTQEYILRSDGIICGKIKKERIQRIHPAFTDAFSKAYTFHKRYIDTKQYEEAYCPMFVNSKGTAMTYFNYRNKFNNLIINHLRPLLLKHEDSECRIYGQLLYEHSLGLHVLRHWFSVQLVLMGEDIAQIQYWRGDSDPQSAFEYLQDKGELLNELSRANEQFSKLLINWESYND